MMGESSEVSPCQIRSILVVIQLSITDLCPGVYQNGSLTHKGFYDACGVFLEFENPAPEWAIFSLHADGETGSLVPCDDSRLTEGRYIVLDTGDYYLNAISYSKVRRWLTADLTGGNPIKVTYTRTEAVRRVVSIPLSTRRLTSQVRSLICNRHAEIRMTMC